MHSGGSTPPFCIARLKKAMVYTWLFLSFGSACRHLNAWYPVIWSTVSKAWNVRSWKALCKDRMQREKSIFSRDSWFHRSRSTRPHMTPWHDIIFFCLGEIEFGRPCQSFVLRGEKTCCVAPIRSKWMSLGCQQRSPVTRKRDFFHKNSFKQWVFPLGWFMGIRVRRRGLIFVSKSSIIIPLLRMWESELNSIFLFWNSRFVMWPRVFSFGNKANPPRRPLVYAKDGGVILYFYLPTTISYVSQVSKRRRRRKWQGLIFPTFLFLENVKNGRFRAML